MYGSPDLRFCPVWHRSATLKAFSMRPMSSCGLCCITVRSRGTSTGEMAGSWLVRVPAPGSSFFRVGKDRRTGVRADADMTRWVPWPSPSCCVLTSASSRPPAAGPVCVMDLV